MRAVLTTGDNGHKLRGLQKVKLPRPSSTLPSHHLFQPLQKKALFLDELFLLTLVDIWAYDPASG